MQNVAVLDSKNCEKEIGTSQHRVPAQAQKSGASECEATRGHFVTLPL